VSFSERKKSDILALSFSVLYFDKNKPPPYLYIIGPILRKILLLFAKSNILYTIRAKKSTPPNAAGLTDIVIRFPLPV
ncbi:MAG: hypothetical protein ACI4RU_05375, partial [Acutalibacteraceae bacterium]